MQKKVKNKKLTYRMLADELNDSKYEVMSDPFSTDMDELPNLMIVVSPLMK